MEGFKGESASADWTLKKELLTIPFSRSTIFGPMLSDAELTPILERMMRGLGGEWLERARRFRPVAEVPIGELMTHPDLGERLGEMVRDLPGVAFGVYYRYSRALKRR